MLDRGIVARVARQRATVITLSWLLILAGAVAALRLPLAFDTAPQAPRLRVQLSAPGITAATLEQQVTRVLETEAAQALAPRRIDSLTSDGAIELRLDFDSRRSRDAAEAEVTQILERARQRWPQLFVTSRIERLPAAHPRLEYVLSTDDATLDSLRAWIDTTLLRTLGDVPGVAALSVRGGPERDVEVVVDARRLAGFGLGLNDLWRALRAAPSSMPVSGLTALAVRLPSGETIGLGEVAQIATQRRERESVRLDGQRGILVEVQLQSDARLLAVAERIDAQLAWLQSNRLLPRSALLQTVTDARHALRLTVGQALLGVSAALLLCLLAAGVLTSWRRALHAAFAVAVSASLSVMVAVLLAIAATPLRLTGFGFGAMLLLPLLSLGLRRRGAAFGDLRAVPRPPVVSTMLALVAALSALVVFAGELSEFFAASAALLAAGALVYRALVPTLGRAFDREEPTSDWSGPRRMPAWIWALLALAAAAMLVRVTATPGAFLHDSGQAVITLAAPDEATEAEIDAAVHDAAAALRADAQFAHVTTHVHRASARPLDSVTPVGATVKLTPRLSRSFDMTRWQQHVQGWTERLRVTLPAWSIGLDNGALGGVGVIVEVHGPETAVLEQLAAAAVGTLKELPDGAHVTPRVPQNVPTFHVRADPDRLTEVNLDVLAVERSVSIARSGSLAGEFVDGEVRYRAYLRESRAARTQEELAGTLLAGELKERPAISLGSIAEVAPVSAPRTLERIDGRHSVRVSLAPMAGATLSQTLRRAEDRLSSLAVPAGYQLVVRADGAPGDVSAWDLTWGAAASLLALGFVAFVVAWRARDAAAVAGFAVVVPVLLFGMSLAYADSSFVEFGFVAAGILAAAARQLGLFSERVTHPRDAAEAVRSGLRFLLPLAAGLLPIALGWVAPAFLSGYAGVVAAGCLITAAMLVAVAALAERRPRWNK
jgi:multidrug efflux pump subunit AcrB